MLWPAGRVYQTWAMLSSIRSWPRPRGPGTEGNRRSPRLRPLNALMRKTSCGVASAHSVPEYSGHWGMRDICPAAQRRRRLRPTRGGRGARSAGALRLRDRLPDRGWPRPDRRPRRGAAVPSPAHARPPSVGHRLAALPRTPRSRRGGLDRGAPPSGRATRRRSDGSGTANSSRTTEMPDTTTQQ
jgi:hypothetical protein